MVIIMEYCNSGSLKDILENPEYHYGFEEDEFLDVLVQISEFLTTAAIFEEQYKVKQGKNVEEGRRDMVYLNFIYLVIDSDALILF